jgi:alanyl-tRNA synthetase
MIRRADVEDIAVTDRIYYTDPALTEFDATVTSCETTDGRIVATLDRSAFYPTSGGQPFDTGTLGAAGVVDVVDLPDGRVGHVLDRALPAGSAVHGTVNWPRRFDHMQQHTGQHILSAAFDRLFKARTVGFHLGAEVSTLDLDRVLSAESIAKAEAEANRIAWENRDVTIRFASEEEAASIQLRKEPTRTGRLRLVEVAGFDVSACGGTHVARAGEVGIVAVKSWEKFRGGMRLEFVCGCRALAQYGVVRDAVAGCIRLISVSPRELPAAVERVQGENKNLRRGVRDLQERLAVFEAAAMVNRGQRMGPVTVVLEIAPGMDQAGLKSIAASAAAHGGVVAGLISATEPVLTVLARSTDVPIDVSAILATLLGQAGGRGGGKPEMAQGGGMTGSPAAIQKALQTIIARALQLSP